MKIIVGSGALKELGWKVNPKDIDIWTDENLPKQKGFDICTIPTHILNLIQTENGVANLDSLYTIKCSHLGWRNPKWNKHKQDVLLFKHKGAKLIPELYTELLEFWKVTLDNKWFLSLNKNKEDFFTDSVVYVYDHDYLHELVAYPNQPMYTHCLKDKHEVLIDKCKFDKLSFDNQVRMFREEITVIALERWLLNPKCKGKFSWMESYIMSLEKTITTLTKNWATSFIVLNLEHFIKPDYSYFKHAIGELL